MPGIKKPRKGALAFWPRKRAKRIYPVITRYPEVEKVKLLAFAGYKAGMTHVIVVDNRKGSPTFGQEITVPITVLDCPPLKVIGLRAYESTVKGLKAISEVYTKDLPKDLEKKIKVKPNEENLKKIESQLGKVSRIRLIICTQPRLSGIGKKTPEVFEIEVGGKDAKEKFEYTKQLLGKEISISDVFREGEVVDAIAVTKGKGMAGPVKRFGVKIQVRKAKKKLRHIGSLGQERPGKVRYTVPMAGQLGFWVRTELNKWLVKIGKGEEITPKAGFKRYGVIKTTYALLEGSIPGPKKRLVMLREAIRPPKVRFLPPQIKEIIKGG